MASGYLGARFGRAPIGSPAASGGGSSMAPSAGGTSIAVSGGISANAGAAPLAVTCLTAIGFLVVFYWATKRIQGLR